jgi:hypothetical protein
MTEPSAQREFVVGNLPPSLIWIVAGDYGVLISAEWSAIFQVVGTATEFEMSCLATLRKYYANEVSENAMTPVENFTEPSMIDSECPVSRDEFRDNGVEKHEPAVKTSCGHHLGRRWLQEWTGKFRQESEVTCPSCRTPLAIGMFPLRT